MSDAMQSSAAVNQTELWLHSRLSGESRWDTAGVASSFSTAKLSDIADIFESLDTKLKLKLLLSFLEIPQRNLDGFQDELTSILSLALKDGDDWVRVTGHIISHLPSSRYLRRDIGSTVDSIDEIKREVNQASANVNAFHSLPLDFPYLNRTIIANQKIAAPVKHFTLKRKPKSAALRAQLTQRDTQRRPTSSSSSVTTPTSKRPPDSHRDHAKAHNVGASPVTPRSTASASSVFARTLSTSAIRSSGRASIGKKTKLLDITEQPITNAREAKKRRKQAETESAAEESKAKKLATDDATTQDNAEQSTSKSPATTDVTSKSEQVEKATKKLAMPSYAVLPQTNLASGHETQPLTERRASTPKQPRAALFKASAAKEAAPPRAPAVVPPREVNKKAAEKKTDVRLHQQRTPVPPQDTFQPLLPPTPPLQQLSHPPLTAPEPSNLTPSATSGTSKKGLSLTREQMIAAQEMFRSANRVTRPEKALILGFMAGARENPFPNQGPVITIKLSETSEEVPIPGPEGPTQQAVLVEMLFEMNYNTGHWRRLKRTRTLAQAQQQQQQQQQQQYGV